MCRLVEHFVDAMSVRDLPQEVEDQIAGHPMAEASTAPATHLFVAW
jgi:hypothetical protein